MFWIGLFGCFLVVCEFVCGCGFGCVMVLGDSICFCDVYCLFSGLGWVDFLVDFDLIVLASFCFGFVLASCLWFALCGVVLEVVWWLCLVFRVLDVLDLRVSLGGFTVMCLA